MKFVEEAETPLGTYPMVELTQHNLEVLLAKLTDPHSMRTLIDPDGKIAVKAVPDSEHYKTRPPGATYTNGVIG